MAPVVSIGMPVFNGELYLERALDSLLAQTFGDFEIIICDNASTDSTPVICERYATLDDRIRYYANSRNLGATPNFNKTVELARGKYFRWAAHDDVHAPEALELALSALQEKPDASICISDVVIVNEHNEEVDRWSPAVELESESPYVRLRCLLRTLGETYPLYGLSKTDVLREAGLLRDYVGSDRTLLAQLAMLGPMARVKAPLHHYRLDERNPERVLATYENTANVDRLPLRTWNVLFGHLYAAHRSSSGVREKLQMGRSIVYRFAVREFRRLIAEVVYSSRIVIVKRMRRLKN